MEIAKRRMAGLAVALCLALCAIAATPVAAMADTPINSLDITVNNFEAGKTVGDVTVTYNDPAGGAGLGGKATRISYLLAKGSWVDCDAAHVLDPTRFYGIEVFLYPEAGYDTAALAAGNVKVNGEAVNYFDNPCGPGSRPPGYPDSTMRVFHYMRDINQGREHIWTEFDLAGGVPAAGDHPLTFGPTVSTGYYKQGDTFRFEELGRQEGKIPVKPGFVFNGWLCELLDGNGNLLKSVGAYDLSADDIPLDVATPNTYKVKLTATWRPSGPDVATPVAIRFDLALGSAPALDPAIFDPRATAGAYKQGDTIPASEFAFFKDAVPVKAGFAFEGWTCALFDGNDAILKPLTDHYDFVGGFLLDQPSDTGYKVAFTAKWRPDGGPAAWSAKITFDLMGGSAPAGDPTVFDPRFTAGSYGFNDTIPGSEFAFFDGVEPTKSGYAFGGWMCVLRSGGGTFLKAVKEDFKSGVELNEASSDGYEVEFRAIWKEEKGAKDAKAGLPTTGDPTGPVAAVLGIAAVVAGGVALLVRRASR